MKPEVRRIPRRLLSTICASLLAILAVGLAPDAGAQEGPDDKKEMAVEVQEATGQKAAPKLNETQGPAFKAEEFIDEKSFESLKKQDEAIVQLKDLISSTSSDNPKRAEFMFNLAEMYWDKSKYYEQSAFTKQDECFGWDDKGEKGRAQSCRRQMQQMLDESKRLREEAVQLYVDIVRGYPDFAELDKVYFYLGTNLMEVGKQEQAIKIFRRLIADFPNTKYVPDVLLNFGEYYFEKEDVKSALKAYKKVGEYPDSSVYAYGKYKEAWCYFNLDQKDKALDQFIEVLEYSKKHPEHPNSKALIRQTRNDMVRTYAHIGSADKAIPFFRKISDDDRETWLKMTERLAIKYADMGMADQSVMMYRRLIDENKESVKTIDYQYEIVRNATAANAYSKDTIKELVRLMKLVQYADDGKFKDIEKDSYQATKNRVESLTRQWATTYHREAQKTKSADLYAMAYFLYKHYLETFPKTEHEYVMTFFYGELLYKLQQWEQAAKAYHTVLALDGKGKYTKDAVRGQVLAYFKIVNTSEEQAKLNTELAEEADNDPCEGKKGEELEKCEAEQAAAKAPPTPREIPDVHKNLLAACEDYVEYWPEGKRIVDVKYTMARTYYDFDHLKEAIALFKDIAYNHSDHRLALIAANLHLDSLNLLQDFEGLHQAALGYLEEQPIKDEPFLEDAHNLNVSIRFKKCTIFDEKEQWKKAADCFVQFYRDFPDSEYVDKALYNAALDFERRKELGKAIKVRIFLLKARPDSELAPKTLYNIGGNYHALAVYSEAAKFYELFVKNFPDREEAEPALSNASTFRYGLGQYDQAIADYEKYLELYGDKNRDTAAQIWFQIAKIYERKGQEKKAIEQYENFIRKFSRKADMDRVLQAHAKIAEYYWNRGGDRNKRRALKKYEETLKVFNRLSDEEKAKLTKGRDAAAQAKFMIGEDVFQEMAEIGIASSDEKELQEKIKKKMEVAEKAQKIFEEVISYRRPDWAIAALYRIGSQYQNFANTVRDSPVPKRLTYDQKEIYKGLLEDQAVVIEAKAVDAYKKALEVAKQESWFNDYSKKAQRELAKLRPKEFRSPSEIRTEPNNFHAGFMRSPFITTVKEEDRLSDFGEGAAQSAEEVTGDATSEAIESSDVGGPQS